MDEQKGEERNAHTVESESGVGRLASGRRLCLRSWGHWSTKKEAPPPLSAKTRFNCLYTLTPKEDREDCGSIFTRGWEEWGRGRVPLWETLHQEVKAVI